MGVTVSPAGELAWRGARRNASRDGGVDTHYRCTIEVREALRASKKGRSKKIKRRSTKIKENKRKQKKANSFSETNLFSGLSDKSVFSFFYAPGRTVKVEIEGGVAKARRGKRRGGRNWPSDKGRETISQILIFVKNYCKIAPFFAGRQARSRRRPRRQANTSYSDRKFDVCAK
jgi:hypothetical protein